MKTIIKTAIILVILATIILWGYIYTQKTKTSDDEVKTMSILYNRYDKLCRTHEREDVRKINCYDRDSLMNPSLINNR